MALPFATSSFLLLVVRPGAPSSVLLVAMPFATSSFLKTEVRSLFSGLTTGTAPRVGSRTLIAGDAVTYGDDWVDLTALWFVPGAGFGPPKDDAITRVHISDIQKKNIRLCSGIQIVCVGDYSPGLGCHDLTLDVAKICFRPEFDPSLPWDFLHMFCRGLRGMEPGHSMDGQNP